MVKIRSMTFGKLMMLFTVLLMFILEAVYLNNAVSINMRNTSKLQILLLILTVLFSVNVVKTKKLSILASSLLLSICMFLSAMYYLDSAGASAVLIASRCFLWVGVFVLGYISTKYYNCEDVIPIAATFVCILFMLIILKNVQFDFSAYRKDTVVTAVYYLLCIVPYVICLKNKRVKVVMLIAVALICFFSFKRSALLVLAAATVSLILINNKRNKKIKYYVIGVSVLGIVGTLMYIQFTSSYGSIVDSFRLWQMRFSYGGGDRYNIWRNVYALMSESTISQVLFGHGYNAVMQDTVSGLSAHNDFLEVLYNYGIVALCLMIAYIVYLVRNSTAIKDADWLVYNGYICSLVIFIVASIPSHMLTYSTYFILLSFYFGYANGIEEKQKDKLINR